MADKKAIIKEFIIKHGDLPVCLFLIVATFATFRQVQNCDFVFDDFRTIVENRHVQGGFTGYLSHLCD